MCAPLPAAADVTARYQLGSEELSVEVDDGGDYRVELAGQFMLLRRAGAEYVVIFQQSEPCVVERQAFLDLVAAKLRSDTPRSLATQQNLALAKVGDEAVGGRRGTLWTAGIDKPGANKIEAVMSADPDLAPVGKILAGTVDSALRAFGDVLPMANLGDTMRELFAKGTPLRFVLMAEVRLKSVSTTAIDAARFALPGPVIDASTLDSKLSSKRTTATVVVPTPPPPPRP
ncbi:hypothetical protein FHS95_003571 [Sphingomonas naasensis]|uniref:DUF4412 domain-containing protein n=1 Tax=Sphingomonas naasensis TaxID=1344951 RepID=A0A4V3QWG7_9SPHN|nr:hypothetical protein [Sphingomonas naasensis]NIJ21860.1 hypothetical protein [Sphingomonas naasensis]TGX42442.1 hypothetical protein E5A74_11425 [Sphingomonas naasensis]